MSNPPRFKRASRAGAVLAAGVACIAVPASAQASAVDLATARPFVALGGQTVTNTGPSVLDGDLGVAPGTSLVGFGPPAVVLGATHANDAVAGQAQSDLTTAYNVAAGQPFAPGDDLTGQDLGNKTLTAGAYHFSSSAQLTGKLTLDARGDPNAQFVFEIGSTLTTASASSVELVNGASPCNVYWQIGSSATLGSTTAFEGNVMALTDISLDSGASVIGRVLARNGQISMINDTLTNAPCRTGPTTPLPPASGGSSPGSTSTVPVSQPVETREGTATISHVPTPSGTTGFRARVSGHLIDRIAFSLDGRRIASRTGSPTLVLVRAAPGRHKLTARVTFKDATPVKRLALKFRAKPLHPRRGPSRFTG